MIVDQHSDSHDLLHGVDLQSLIPLERTKQASAPTYAWEAAGLFPLHTAHDAVYSLAYASRQAARVPAAVLERLKTACALYNVNPDVVVQRTVTRVKQASPTVEDDDFILPSLGLWPVKTASDWRAAWSEYTHSARKLLPDTRAEAAIRFIKKAADLGFSQRDVPMELYKRAGLTLCDAGALCDHFEIRAQVAASDDARQAYKQAADALMTDFPPLGLFVKRDELIKIADAVSALDMRFGMDKHYDTRILDPYLTVFNFAKVASQTVDLAGTDVPVSLLTDLGETQLGAILGEDFVAEVRGPDGQIDDGLLATVAATLPLPMKRDLLANVQQNLAQGAT